jgi:quinol monooxygenase YgiN
MAYMFGRISVDDYAHFRDTFDSKADMRKAAGVVNSNVFRSVDDPNEVVVQLEFSSADQAKTFSQSEGLRNAIKQANTKGEPRILVVDQT